MQVVDVSIELSFLYLVVVHSVFKALGLGNFRVDDSIVFILVLAFEMFDPELFLITESELPTFRLSTVSIVQRKNFEKPLKRSVPEFAICKNDLNFTLNFQNNNFNTYY